MTVWIGNIANGWVTTNRAQGSLQLSLRWAERKSSSKCRGVCAGLPAYGAQTSLISVRVVLRSYWLLKREYLDCTELDAQCGGGGSSKAQ